MVSSHRAGVFPPQALLSFRYSDGINESVNRRNEKGTVRDVD